MEILWDRSNYKCLYLPFLEINIQTFVNVLIETREKDEGATTAELETDEGIWESPSLGFQERDCI